MKWCQTKTPLPTEQPTELFCDISFFLSPLATLRRDLSGDLAECHPASPSSLPLTGLMLCIPDTFGMQRHDYNQHREGVWHQLHILIYIFHHNQVCGLPKRIDRWKCDFNSNPDAEYKWWILLGKCCWLCFKVPILRNGFSIIIWAFKPFSAFASVRRLLPAVSQVPGLFSQNIRGFGCDQTLGVPQESVRENAAIAGLTLACINIKEQ